MKRSLIALTLTIIASGLLTADASAGGGPFKKWRAHSKSDTRGMARAAHDRLYQPYPFSNYESVDDAYPKYIGAFHSRYFNDLGIPSGDVGIRANTLHMLPW